MSENKQAEACRRWYWKDPEAARVKARIRYQRQKLKYGSSRTPGRKQYEDANRDKINAKQRKYTQRNLEEIRARDQIRGKSEKRKQQRIAWYNKHTYKFLAWNAKRRAIVKQATPSWIDEEAVFAIYKEAQKLGMHVDHIVPLRGKNICGLHVENNLQLLSKADNLSKGNRYNG